MIASSLFLLMISLGSIAQDGEKQRQVQIEMPVRFFTDLPITMAQQKVISLEPQKYQIISEKELQLGSEDFTIFQLKKQEKQSKDEHFLVSSERNEEYYCSNGNMYIPKWNTRDYTVLGANLGLNLLAYAAYKNEKAPDKLKHFATGFILSNVSTGLAQLILPKKMKRRKLISALIGTSIAFVAGVAKEIKDSDGSGNVEFKDAFATSLGGLGGSITISFTDMKGLFSNKKRLNKAEMEKLFTLSELERLEQLNNKKRP